MGAPQYEDPAKKLKDAGAPQVSLAKAAPKATTQTYLPPKMQAPTPLPTGQPTGDAYKGKVEGSFLPDQYDHTAVDDDPAKYTKTGAVDEGFGKYTQTADRPTQDNRGPGAYVEPPPPPPDPFRDPETMALERQHERDVSRMMYQGMQEARAIAAQRGYAPGSEQFNQIMRESKAQINDAALKSQRGVFGTIRERSQDMRDEILQNAPANVQAFLAGKPLAEQKEFMAKITDPATGKIKDEYKNVNWDTLSQRYLLQAQAKFPHLADKYKDENGQIDYKAFYDDPEVRPFVDGKVSEQIDAMADPLSDAGKKREAEAARTERIDKFIETGDYKSMDKDDWLDLTPDERQKMKDAGRFFEAESVKNDLAWLNDDNVGKIVEKGGKMYRITAIKRNVGHTKSQVGSWDSDHVQAVPVEGGDPIDVWKSDSIGERRPLRPPRPS
jgi:hypothetical protein